ncbi:MAG: vanadium-dependent haloperoxidase [Bacillota bacterium]
MNGLKRSVVLASVAAALVPLPSKGDVVTDWNEKACMLVANVGPGAPGHRLIAAVQVAVYDAVSSIDGKHAPFLTRVDAPQGASVDAAVAAANRRTLLALVPAEEKGIEAAYQAALAKIPDGKAKDDGIAVGEKAGLGAATRAEKDGWNTPDTYQPHTTPGVYVPTMIPAAYAWTKRTPWVMTSPSQFRPGPPPRLDSDTWAKDFEQVKMYGAKASTARSKEQTDIAQFWEETRPLLYHGVLRSVANMPGRSVSDNARLLARGSVAVDDALIAVFDAKYTYNFWRPITAIRNGHMAVKDGKAEPGWTPFINTPMHPEYPCAHCVSSGAIGAVLDAELGKNASGLNLRARSPTAKDAERSWTTVAAFMDEVKMARIYDGVHYRNSTEVGNALGYKVGELAVQKIGN